MALALGAAGVAFILAFSQGNLSEILVENGCPRPVTGRGAINDSSAGDLRRYRLLKNSPEGPNKVGSAGESGFMHMHARFQGLDRTPLWSSQVAVSIYVDSLKSSQTSVNRIIGFMFHRHCRYWYVNDKIAVEGMHQPDNLN